ncbi:LOW QUALITY PROTEIN: kinase-like domain-containing protein [Colletotrichum navitas]|uniref:Kinase-like domain-containing protein n=1 Tax=Colletotrichum navitas TaxID=681940 RepID=A0AAD8PXW6_9PEZI|nr:LOW QUALITY PROTEIN: kinase-like domain-containing protein [Colletotrichum navitas]KAK1586094.1 LOW QUALITY PROTEIN: kinase-like domain-containing protein [Colletotrichum navitas]
MIDDLPHGRYRIVGKLGFGGYSTICLAHDDGLERYVAIKVGVSSPSLSRREPRILRDLSRSTPTSYAARVAIDASDAIPSILNELDIQEASFSRLFPIEVARAPAAKLTMAVAFVHGRGFFHGAFNQLSIDQFRNEFGEPETVPISRLDGSPLPPNIPPRAVVPLYLGEKFPLADAHGLVLNDFGEAFAPATEQRLGKDCNTPGAKTASEALFEPDAPLSYPSDIWSLGTAIWEILGMEFILSESETQGDIAAQQIDVLGSQHGLPSTWPPLDKAFDEFVQKCRKKREMAGVLGEEETRAILDMMRGMLKSRPEERLTVEEVLGSERMTEWVLPQLETGVKMS